jgi:hypothetical protein
MAHIVQASASNVMVHSEEALHWNCQTHELQKTRYEGQSEPFSVVGLPLSHTSSFAYGAKELPAAQLNFHGQPNALSNKRVISALLCLAACVHPRSQTKRRYLVGVL